MTSADKIDGLINALRDEIHDLRNRLAVSDEDMEHLLAIARIEFMLWYDPDNEACERYGKELRPHIRALNDKFRFKK